LNALQIVLGAAGTINFVVCYYALNPLSRAEFNFMFGSNANAWIGIGLEYFAFHFGTIACYMMHHHCNQLCFDKGELERPREVRSTSLEEKAKALQGANVGRRGANQMNKNQVMVQENQNGNAMPLIDESFGQMPRSIQRLKGSVDAAAANSLQLSETARGMQETLAQLPRKDNLKSSAQPKLNSFDYANIVKMQGDREQVKSNWLTKEEAEAVDWKRFHRVVGPRNEFGRRNIYYEVPDGTLY